MLTFSRVTRTCSKALAIVALCTLTACASGSTDDGQSGSADITADQANQQFHGSKLTPLLRAFPAGDSGRAEGVATWDLYSGQDGDFTGTVFYASDAGGDVKYAFALDVNTSQLTAMVLDKSGKPVQNTAITSSTEGDLKEDIAMLQRELKRQAAAAAPASAAEKGVSCVVDLAITTLSGLAASSGWWATGAAVGAFTGSSLEVLGVSAAMVAVLGSVATVAGLAVGVYVAFKLVKYTFEDNNLPGEAVDACKGAFRGF